MLKGSGSAGHIRSAVATAALVIAIVVMLLGIQARGPGSGTASAAPASPSEGNLSATIRRTSHGIPHIVADDFAGLGYGYGFSLAQDNICVVAEGYVTVR